MPFLFTCPHCGTRTQIPESFIGQSGACHGCGKEVRIDAPSADGASEPAPATNASVGAMIAVVLGMLFVGIGVVGVALIFVMPRLRNANVVDRRALSESSLQQITAAMHTYHQRHGTFPPAYTVDADGKRLHSWRVLLLPYLGPEATSLYREFHLNEPWDSSHNLNVAAHMPEVYRSPADPAARTGNVANYHVITGKDTFFPETGESLNTKTCLAPLNHTILVVESVARSEIWTKPDEYETAKTSFELNTFRSTDLSGPHPGGVMVGLADGSIFFLQDDTPLEWVEGMTTRSNQDAVPPDL